MTPADADPKMDAGVRRRIAALVLVFVASAPAATAATPGSPNALQRKLARALRVPHIPPAHSAALALDLGTGAVLYAQNATRSFAPASNEKLPLTYAALSLLGPGYRFETDVLGQGSQEGALWNGALVLKGGGDPTLTHWGLQALAKQVRAAGIGRVTGGVIADESWFDAQRTVAGWKPGFYLNESPPISALVVDRDHVGRYLSPNPALAAGLAFRTALRQAGVGVAGPVRLGVADDYVVPLASLQSPSLAAIVRFMDRESDNFTAEMLLKELGASQLDRGTSAAGVPTAGVRIVDGSGLSLLDRLTAIALDALLRIAWNDSMIHQSFVSALPVAGVNGTLHDRMRRGPAHGTVIAKTGTTEEASALSGFVRNRYVFAVLQNGHPLPYWWARVAQDRFAQVLAAQ